MKTNVTACSDDCSSEISSRSDDDVVSLIPSIATTSDIVRKLRTRNTTSNVQRLLPHSAENDECSLTSHQMMAEFQKQELVSLSFFCQTLIQFERQLTV